MTFTDTLTNGEISAICRATGITTPETDPIQFGIGVVWAAARRLGHPITIGDASALTNAETEAILSAADKLPAAAGLTARSAELEALLASIQGTPSAAPDPQPSTPATSGPQSSPSEPESTQPTTTS
ncbi:hypothetical protein [Acidipropionibacterium timonense]|uniref:hypothetical protein n=1 Tax=Acidipropionibacterium timonense TaxID=2161818 RepID=UPI001031AF5E|nr:hypothetical protein [Acidipropionibacterium timonense]